MIKHWHLDKHYFYLIKEFSIAKFKVKDQQSFFGFLWSFLSPFIMTNILFFLFKNRMAQKYDISFFLYILIGTVTWNFFVVATGFGLTSIINKGAMVRNVAFPKEILVYSDIVVFTLQYILELLVILIFIVLSGTKLSLHIIFFPIIIAIELLLITGIVLFLSCAYVIYARDLGHIWNMITRMLFFMVPIFYPLSIVPERMRLIVTVNPLTQILIFSRDILLYHKIPPTLNLLIVFLFCLAFFLFGYIFFKRHEFRMIENV